MYIYDTGKGYNIIITLIADGMVVSHSDLSPSHSKVSLLRYNKNNDAYFKRLGSRIYLRDIGDEYTS